MPTGQMSALGGRRKKRSPYLDEIRGNYGKATADVIAQKQDKLNQETLNVSKEANKIAQNTASAQAKAAQFQTGMTGLTTAMNIAQNPIFKTKNPDGSSGGASNFNKGLSSLLAGVSAGSMINTSHDWKKYATGAGVTLAADYAQGGISNQLVNQYLPEVGKKISQGASTISDMFSGWFSS